jgi:hypothetical protein
MKITQNDFLEEHLCALYQISGAEMSNERLFQICKQTIIGLATFSGILKMDSMQLTDGGEVEELFTIYRNQKIHLSLKEFLDHMCLHWTEDPIFDKY